MVLHRRRLAIGLALLVFGSAVGLGVARWQAARSAAPPAPVAAPLQAAGPAVTGTAPRSAASAPAPARRSVEQLDARGLLLRGGVAGSDWRVARLQGNPQVLVLEYPGLAEQGAAMNRVAAFVEKDGAPRDRVLDDGELAQLIRHQGDNPMTFYQGHDYAADDLARFFSIARAQGVVLNAQEKRLLSLLLEQGVLTARGTAFEAQGLQAMVTFTGTQPDDPRTPQDETIDERRRESVLLHELSHGLYFTSASYREYCRRFWRERMTAQERAAFTRVLVGMNYDRRNEDLLINEMQALLMHTPDTRAFNAASLGMSERQLEALRVRFAAGWPPR